MYITNEEEKPLLPWVLSPDPLMAPYAGKLYSHCHPTAGVGM